MNNVAIKGFIRNKRFSHLIDDVEYEQADLICPRNDGKDDDIILLKYKKYSCNYAEGDLIDIKGNIRSYSYKNGNKNVVEVYLFTYFDMSDDVDNNKVMLDGYICKINELMSSPSGKDYIHFIIANNIFVGESKKINSYIPCTAYGEVAKKISNLKVGDKIQLNGKFHSHTYKKRCSNGDIEYRVAHEVVVDDYIMIDN